MLEFIQARPVTNRFPAIPFGPTWQPGAVAQLPPADDGDDDQEFPAEVRVTECAHDGLNRYQVPVAVYQRALKEVFFEPSPRNVALYNRFTEPLKRLVNEWWDRIEDSRKFEKNRVAVEAYHRTLKPGDVTIAGLICEGGQGMRTANNGRFLGYLEGTPQAQDILKRRKELADRWEHADRAVAAAYRSLKAKGGDFPEIADALKERFAGEGNWTRLLGFRRGEIYRIVLRNLVFDVEGLSEEERQRITYHGIEGHTCWVPFRKGDPEGNKWVSFNPLYIRWDGANVAWLFEHSGRPEPNMPVIRNAHLYFTEGITWTAVANHVAMKARLQPKCVFDADSMRLTPVPGTLSALVFLALLNSDLLSFFKWRFLKNTQKYEIGDLRLLPVVIPSPKQRNQLETLARTAIAMQTDILQNSTPRQAELDAIQAQVNEAVEKLYGVRGLGPFDQF